MNLASIRRLHSYLAYEPMSTSQWLTSLPFGMKDASQKNIVCDGVDALFGADVASWCRDHIRRKRPWKSVKLLA